MSEIKKYFTSRFGKDGVILTADFSQLEVVVLAFLSKDKNLVADLNNGVDMHCQSAAFVTEKDYHYIKAEVTKGDKYWVQVRKDSKEPTFQLCYGAGAHGISQNSTLSKSQAKEFIENYYSRYSGVKQWQDDTIEEVQQAAVPSGDTTQYRGLPAAKGTITGVLGRRWTFTEEDSPKFMFDKGISTSFSPPKIKNYPVQGTAFDVVAMAGAYLWETLAASDIVERCIIFNTVHDSFMLDVHKEVLTEAIEYVKSTLLAVDMLMSQHFGVEFDLPLGIEIETGPTWAEQTLISA